jgi:hypothetical protein
MILGLIKSALQVFEEWASGREESGSETHMKGVVVAYDPATQKADVQPMVQRRRYVENGSFLDDRLPVIPSVPVEFGGSGKWDLIHDLEVGDRVTLHCFQDSLDAWLSSGDEAPGSDLKRGALADCTATPGGRDFGHPRIPCPKGVMRIGAVDGPQIVFDLTTLSVTLAAFNEIKILGQARVDIRSEGDVYIQGRWVDPLGGAIN